MSPADHSIYLIVNADDFNLTEGVSKGILEAHDQGVVTSTSFLVNLPCSVLVLRELKKRSRLGVGLHLNITLGHPVSRPEHIPSLLNGVGVFKKRSELDFRKISWEELRAEYEEQIGVFKKIFGRLPTHLDTHHHLHEKRKVFEVLVRTAIRYRLPIRKSRLCDSSTRKVFESHGLMLPNHLLEDLDHRRAWNLSSLRQAIQGMKSGYYELMCHPALCDRALMKKSSFNRPRLQELKALVSPEIKSAIKEKKIRLISFESLRLTRRVVP